MLHWLHEMRNKQRYEISILGVTATPFRILADTHLFPEASQISSLRTDPPFPGAKYYGFIDNGNPHFKKIEVIGHPQTHNKTNSVIEILTDILNEREYYGDECPFVLVPVEYVNDKQDDLKKAIDDHFDGLPVYVDVFNQKTQTNLQGFFDTIHQLPNLAWYRESGIFVMIANRTVDTGVTVKTNNPEQRIYLPGITDQISPRFKYLEHDVQALRICGWYPAEHKSRLHVPEDQLDLFDQDMWTLTNQIVNTHNGHPQSIANIKSPNPDIRHILGDKTTDIYAYQEGDRIMPPQKSSSEPEGVAILQTTVEAIGEKAGKFGAMRLCDLEKKTKLQNELRKLLGFKIQRGQRGLLMSYSTSREKEILKACFNPKPDSTQWQVNAFVYGPQSDQSQIKDCYVVKFTESWDIRRQMTDILDDGDISGLAFKILDDLWYECRVSTSCYNHQYIDKVGQALSEKHREVMDKISKLDLDVAKPKRQVGKNKPLKEASNPWIFFRGLQAARGANGSPTECSKHWKDLDLKTKIQTVFGKDLAYEKKFKRGLKICDEYFGV